MDGKFITKAQANGNTREAFPTARIDQLAEKRRKGKIKRAENAIKLANAEVNPALEQAAVWDELGHLGGKRHRGGVCGIAENGHRQFCVV